MPQNQVTKTEDETSKKAQFVDPLSKEIDVNSLKDTHKSPISNTASKKGVKGNISKEFTI